MSNTPHDPSEEPLVDSISAIEEEGAEEPISMQLIRKRLKSFLWKGLILLALVVLVATVGTGTAGWYTSRSQFCSSCHIMEPYYASWQDSSHSHVACTKCHFPPGVAEKARGKVLGLLQLAKYLTSSQGPRPAAEIPDASCLRSGCHETRLLSGRVDFKGIAFDHAKHLGMLRRGKELRCTSCHSQIVQGNHMTVTETTCFLCHFKDGHFNEGLGACTRCHQIPDTEYDLGGGVKFHHDLAYEQGVDCASCHSDLIQGNGEVPPERCTVCHNREHDLERITDPTFIHAKHVTEHKVDCMACHLTLRHSLDSSNVADAVAKCSSCHPNQHEQQVAMLNGTGAKLIPSRPSNMLNARLSCTTCHTSKEVSDTGTILMKASLQTCVGCHDASEIGQLQTYHEELRTLLTKFDEEFKRIDEALQAATIDPLEKLALQQRLDDLEHDVRFMHAGNDIHNSHYASELTGKLLSELTTLCQTLQLDPPTLQLPEEPQRAGSDADPPTLQLPEEPTRAGSDADPDAPSKE